MVRASTIVIALLVGACRSSAPAAPPEPEPRPEPTTTEPEPDQAVTAPTAEPAPPPAVSEDSFTRVERIDELELEVPASWVRVEPKTRMRKAEFQLPTPEGEGELELIVFRFPGGAGGVEANLERWRGQIDGTDSPAPPIGVGPLLVTRLDRSGTYVGAVAPGSTERHDRPNSRLLAAVVTGSGDPLYIKCVGSANAVGSWVVAFEGMLRSLRVRAEE